MWMIHLPGIIAKGSAKPSPGTVRKDGEGLGGNIISLLWSFPAKHQAQTTSISHTCRKRKSVPRRKTHQVTSKCYDGNVSIFFKWWVRFDSLMVGKKRADTKSEAALPGVPLLLVASMLPVTLMLLGLTNRRTTRNKFCLPSFGSTCTIILTSLCRGDSYTLTAMAQVWVDDEAVMLTGGEKNHDRWAESLWSWAG